MSASCHGLYMAEPTAGGAVTLLCLPACKGAQRRSEGPSDTLPTIRIILKGCYAVVAGVRAVLLSLSHADELYEQKACYDQRGLCPHTPQIWRESISLRNPKRT